MRSKKRDKFFARLKIELQAKFIISIRIRKLPRCVSATKNAMKHLLWHHLLLIAWRLIKMVSFMPQRTANSPM